MAAGDRAGVFEAGRQVARRLIWDLLDVEIPVDTALNGDATGLAATIALFSDAVFMADTAIIADPHVRLGVVAGDGVLPPDHWSWVLPWPSATCRA